MISSGKPSPVRVLECQAFGSLLALTARSRTLRAALNVLLSQDQLCDLLNGVWYIGMMRHRCHAMSKSRRLTCLRAHLAPLEDDRTDCRLTCNCQALDRRDDSGPGYPWWWRCRPAGLSPVIRSLPKAPAGPGHLSLFPQWLLYPLIRSGWNGSISNRYDRYAR